MVYSIYIYMDVLFVVTSFALLVELRLSTDNGLLLYVINLRIQGHLRLYISDAT